MEIIIAPDSYKGSLSAIEVCNIIEAAIYKVMPNAKTKKIPVSDGGDGMLSALIQGNGGDLTRLSVHDPLDRPIQAEYGIVNNDIAVIEMAAASGLTLIKEIERNPLKTTTFGTGQMIYDAVVQQGLKKVILGLGGSATNDGGLGLAAALGVRFLDENNQMVQPYASNFAKIKKYDLSFLNPRLFEVDFLIACDVSNPLCGENGAATIYGPQKGASANMVTELDQGLKHLCGLFEKNTKKSLINMPGLGAAGGTALPLLALFNAQIQSGLEIILDAIDFDQQIRGADLIITGEGKTDCQSLMGKVVSGVGKRAKKLGIPAIIISGALEPGYETLYDQGIVAAFDTCINTLGLDWQMQNAAKLLENQVENLMKLGLLCDIKAYN
ncbi:glycerate kinase [Eubacteriaceae bacterium ES2]|nr:glycerate kinase [Eubacteriaceae bacterium ES2]